MKEKVQSVESENPRVVQMKHVALITSYAAADVALRSVELWHRRSGEEIGRAHV